MIDRRGAVALMLLLPAALSRALAAASLPKDTPLARFPFELLANAIYFRARLNGKGPYLFSLDTGSSNSVIASELTAQLGIATGTTFQSMGAGSDSNSAAKIDRLDFQLPGGIRRSVTDGAAISLSGLWPLLARQFCGIVGYDVLEPFVVEIDYAGRTLSLFDSRTYVDRSQQTFPVHLYGRYDPQLDGTIEVGGQGPIPVRFTLDTGAGGTIVSSPLVEKYDLIRAAGRITNTQDKGVGGAVPTEVMARLSRVRIGSFVIREPLVALSLDKMGSLSSEAISVNLGGNILQRFKLAINYRRGTVGLTPNSHFSDPFPSDASGLLLSADSRDFHKFVVQSVVPGSPAAGQMFQPGDQIVAVNGAPAGRYALWELEEVLKKNGAEVLLSTRRGNATTHKILKLRSLL
jgi:hypothetical protein